MATANGNTRSVQRPWQSFVTRADPDFYRDRANEPELPPEEFDKAGFRNRVNRSKRGAYAGS